ncbi:protein GAMETE EXPRESSED 2-like [Bidens hawaiensis]|uniref:protein GAMETE EXPRESSED 2-like n=1 Tax=Bidens hawaiensis TaxID=980011 RepID=UPI00404A0399
MFSVEVSFGTLSARLPAQLISTTEVKLKGSKQWQLLQTFVEISKHFTLNEVKGIRILGTLDECNALLHQLVYYGGEHNAVLKLKVNDMGWFGCYPDCSEMMLAPLMSEATVSLITRTPMNALVAHSLGFLLVIESIVLSTLAVILMFFTCKCVTVLVRERRKQQEEPPNLQLNEPQNNNEQMSSVGSPDNAIQLTGNCPSPVRQTEEASNLLAEESQETTVAEIATVL